MWGCVEVEFDPLQSFACGVIGGPSPAVAALVLYEFIESLRVGWRKSQGVEKESRSNKTPQTEILLK
jgi:hypothetical protein